MSLAEELAAAEAHVTALKQKIARATCREIGAHDMQSIGGKNAGCSEDCNCSVPVNECTRCGVCDYGQNAEARQIVTYCRLRLLNQERER